MSNAVSSSVFETFGSAKPLHAQSLREQALDSGRLDLSELWAGLAAGDLRFSNAFAIADQCFTTLELSHGPAPRRSPAATWLLLQRILAGECAKAIADEQHIALSSLSFRCSALLADVGPERRISRTPALLVLAAHAAKGIPLDRALADAVAGGGPKRWVVRTPNPVLALRPLLTHSEYEVARLAIDGRSHAQIATLLGKSNRTVANQLASTFRKVDVSGRSALRAKAVREYCAAQGVAPR